MPLSLLPRIYSRGREDYFGYMVVGIVVFLRPQAARGGGWVVNAADAGCDLYVPREVVGEYPSRLG